jgi:2-keto-4-pentenoate hydratase/2-oxohepta-3-ene-1,7-dioic acid hydratase in catechol pathway
VKYVRFDSDGRVLFGLVSSDGGSIVPLDGPPWAGGRPAGPERAFASLHLRAPAVPSKIVAVGLNYRDHAAELSMAQATEPVLFLKPPSSILDPGGVIVRPPQSVRVDFEAELAFVIGRTCRNVSRESAMEHIAGFTCFNDVTARDLQKKDVQWTRAKSFDTFSPFGPWIVTPDEVALADAKVRARVNGVVKQESSTKNFLFDIPYLVAFISSVMTLVPGDVVTTGTPPGVGPLESGDTVEIIVDGVGILMNKVK